MGESTFSRLAGEKNETRRLRLSLSIRLCASVMCFVVNLNVKSSFTVFREATFELNKLIALFKQI